MADRSEYQNKIIKRYYDNKDAIMLQKLSELTTELYLSEGKKRLGVWKRVVAALENLKIDPAKIDQLVSKDDPALLAKFVQEKLK